MRVDFTLLGWRGIKTYRGNLSILFKGKGMAREGSLLIANHEAKTVEKAFTDVTETNIEENIKELLKVQKQTNSMQTQEYKLIPAKSQGNAITQIIEGFNCVKYKAKCRIINQPQEKTRFSQKYQSYDDYFADSLVSVNSLQNSYCENAKLETTQELHNKEKQYKAVVWISENYPLKFCQIIPIMELMSYTSQHISKFSEFLLQSKLDSNDGIPIKATIPLFCSITANLTLANLTFEKVPDEFMDIDAKYIPIKGCSKALHFTPSKINSPGSINSSQSELMNTPKITKLPKIEENIYMAMQETDRLRWSSYESEENEESILRAKDRFELLLNEADNVVENIPVVTVRQEDCKQTCELDDDFNNLELGIEEEKALKTVENVQSHITTGIKTLNDIINAASAYPSIKTTQMSKIKDEAMENDVNHSDSIRTLIIPFKGTNVKSILTKTKRSFVENAAKLKTDKYHTTRKAEVRYKSVDYCAKITPPQAKSKLEKIKRAESKEKFNNKTMHMLTHQNPSITRNVYNKTKRLNVAASENHACYKKTTDCKKCS